MICYGRSMLRSRWFSLVILCAATLMIILDGTIVTVALPVIQADLGFTPASLSWVMDSYLIAFGGLLLLSGRLGDLLGRKRMFLSGAALFGLASLAAGLAGSGAELIGARVVQGAAAAAMAPQVLATFRAIFAGSERGNAFGIYGAMLGFASAIGLGPGRGA